MKIITLAVIAAIISHSAAAETSKTWGTDYTPSTMSIVPSTTHEADVIFENTITNISPKLIIFVFNDLKYFIEVAYGSGDIPDTFRVIPPAGFYTIPNELIVNDGTTGIIEIHAIPLG
jgi:hypothetical protein